MGNIKEEGSPDGGESETEDISVSCNYSFDILCAQFYLLFVLFTVLKTRVRSSSMLVKCTTTEQHL